MVTLSEHLTRLCFDTKISETKFCHVKGYQVGHIVLEIDKIDGKKVFAYFM